MAAILAYIAATVADTTSKVAGSPNGTEAGPPVHRRQMTEFFMGQAAHRDDQVAVLLDLAEVTRAAPRRGSSCGSVIQDFDKCLY